MESLHSLKLRRFFPCTWTPTAHKSMHMSHLFLRVSAGKIKSKSNHISRKCHWLPLHPQSPQCHCNTGQISHYEDKWLHKNIITYHLTCRTSHELLKEQLIRAIGEETQRPEFPSLKNKKTNKKKPHGDLTDIFMVHLRSHTWPTKHVGTCQDT